MFGDAEMKDEYSDWWFYPQEKGAAVFVKPDLAVIMLGEYDALKLLHSMNSTAEIVTGAFDRYLTLGTFPRVVPNER